MKGCDPGVCRRGGPCWLSGTCEDIHCQKGPLVSHAHAALTPRARLRVAQLVVDNHVSIAEVAARFQCSWPTVKRWVDRYRAGESMQDRSSRPHHSPKATPLPVVKCCVSLRLRLREGPVQLAARLGIAPLNGGPYPHSLSAEPAFSCRSGHWGTSASLRARPSRQSGPRRRQEAGQHS